MQLSVKLKNLETTGFAQELIIKSFDQLGRRHENIHKCDVTIEKEEMEDQPKYRIRTNVLTSKSLLSAASDGETVKKALVKLVSNLDTRIGHHMEERAGVW